MKCTRCWTDKPEDAVFCKRRGQSLQTELVCGDEHHATLPDSDFCVDCGRPLVSEATAPPRPVTVPPAFFPNGRYQVKKLPGEARKKKIHLAHDNVLDRDVAFALIKREDVRSPSWSGRGDTKI